jgi:hypothetical protein
MSFNLSKNGSGEIIKKTVSAGTTLQTILTANPYAISTPSALFNDRNYDFVSSTISLQGGGTTTITQSNIDKVSNITAGSTSASKALVLNSNKEISGINIIKCNSITANGVVIPTEISGGASAPANDYFSDNTSGTVVNNKAVVLGSQKTLTGAKKITGTVSDVFSYDRTGRSINVQLFKSTNLSSSVWKDCCYSLDLKKFACVGYGKVALSNNGTSWTEVVVAGVNFNKIYWSSTLGLYFAITTDGVYESIDGTEWDISLTSTGLEDIEVGNSFIIAIGTKMFTKSVSNGSQWAEVSMTASMNTVSWKGISFGKSTLIGSRFVVVGNNKMAFCLEANVNTPASWTAITLTGLWNSISYGNDLFIAVNSQSQPNNKVTTSTNGSIWSAMNLSWYSTEDEITTTGFKSVKFFSQLNVFFVLTKNPKAGETRVYYTKNGHEWHNFKHQSDSHITSICWSPDLGKVFGLGKGIDTSEDDSLAYCHTLRPCNVVYSNYGSSEYGNFNNIVTIEETGIVFACNTNGLFYSNDGKVFNKVFINNSGQNQLDTVSRRIYSVAYSQSLNLYVAGSEYSVGVSSSLISSTDGINWTQINNSFNASCITMVWSPAHGRFYGNGTNVLIYSSDGVNWSSQTLVGLYEISKVDSDIFAHGVHASKRLFKINSDLSYTASNTVQPFNQIVKYNNVLYSKVSNSIYTSSNDGMDWTELLNLSAVQIIDSVIYNSDLDCIVIYTNDNMVRAYKNSTWTTYTTINYLARTAGFKGCYSNYWKCIFIPSVSFGVPAISKTRTFFSQTCISNSMLKAVNELIYKTIPDYSIYKRELADNVYTALNTNFTANTTPTSTNAVRNIQYSRSRSTWYALRTTPTDSVVTLYTINNFATTSNHTGSVGIVDLGHNLNLCAVRPSGGGALTLGDYPATSATVTTTYANPFSTYTNFIPGRMKLSYNKDFFYMFRSGILDIHWFGNQTTPQAVAVSTYNITTQTITVTDGCYNSATDAIIYMTSSPRKVYKYRTINGTYSSYVSEFDLPAGTYYQLDFFPDANIYILTGDNKIYYSYNGETWTATPTTSMTSYTYSAWSMKYIPELKIMGIVSTTMFAYTHDGVNWIITPTAIAKAWTSFDYSPDYSILILHATGDGGIMVSSPLYTTMKNTITPMNGIVDKNCMSVLTKGAFMGTEKNNHALELNGNLFASASGKNMFMSKNIFFGVDFQTNNLELTRTDTNQSTSQSIKLNGNYLNLDNTVANSLNLISKFDSTGLVYRNSLLLLRNGENLVVNNLAGSNLNITSSAFSKQREVGPVIADSNLNVSLDNVGVNSLSINGTTYSNTKENIYSTVPPTEDPLLSVDSYMNFRNTQFYVGNSGTPIMGSAYSEELNVMVIYTNANATGLTQVLNVSKDRGATWQRISITNAFTFTCTTTETSNKLIWLSSIKRFILVQDNNVMFSLDGITWEENAIAFGTNPTIFYDSKLTRLTVSTTTKIAYANDINNLGGTWTIGSTATDLRMITYHSSLDRYFFRNLSNTTILKATADIYATTITTVDSTHAVAMTDMLVFNDWIYICGGIRIYRRNTNTTTISTEVFASTNASVIFKSMTIIPRLNILVAFSNVSFAYTSDGTSWVHLPLSQELINYTINASLEGVMSNMFWAVDRLYMLTCTAGDLLESDVDNKQNASSIEYLDVAIKNKMSLDNLHNSNAVPVNLFMRHSTTTRNMYATAYGSGYFLSVGTDVNMYSTSLKSSQTFETHTGAWKDIAFVGGNFVKVRNDTVSYRATPISGSWTDVTVTGNWVRIQKAKNTIVIYSSDKTIKYASSVSGQWNDLTLPSGVSSSLWNNIKIPSFLDNKLFLLGNGYIANCDMTYDGNQNASFGSWTVKTLDGNWNDISYSKNMYIVAGNGLMAKTRNLSYFRKTIVFRNYHRVMYSRVLGDFFLMTMDVNACTQSFTGANQTIKNNQTNAVIRTNDGVNWTSSFRISKFNIGGQLYNLSNIYYFEETDQFALPLNNSGNKIYIYSNYYIAHKSTTKITTPATLLINNTLASGSIDIARGDNLSLASPALFNVFSDSAAKPATSTWTTVSDERLKENIVSADLDLCLNNIKNIPLKYYKWKDEYISESQSSDRHKLGWIAQDVEVVYPKAVNSQSMFGIEDCKTLDTDQLIASLYGAIKLLTKKIEEKEQAVADAQ